MPGLVFEPRLLALPQAVAHRHLCRQVGDPELRRSLTPNYRFGCKRVLLSNRYYPALAQPNAELVTDPIVRVGARSITTADGAERESRHSAGIPRDDDERVPQPVHDARPHPNTTVAMTEAMVAGAQAVEPNARIIGLTASRGVAEIDERSRAAVRRG